MARARVLMTPGIKQPPCWWVSPKAETPTELLEPLRDSRTSPSPKTLPRAPGILHRLTDSPSAPRAPQPLPSEPSALAKQPLPCLQGKSYTRGWLQTSWAGTSPSSAAWARVRVSEQNHMIPAGSMVKGWWGWWEKALILNRAGAE